MILSRVTRKSLHLALFTIRHHGHEGPRSDRFISLGFFLRDREGTVGLVWCDDGRGLGDLCDWLLVVYRRGWYRLR